MFEYVRHARRRRKPGWFRRAPDPREVGDRLGRLIKRMERGAVVHAGWSERRYRVELALHPAAPPVRLVLEADGELAITAETGRVGPGYHADVGKRVAPLAEELDYAWTDDAAPPDAIYDWLASELRAGTTRLGLERAFRVDAAVLTPLGPRDAAWRDAVIAEPRRGADAFAWVDRPAAYSRALLAMWHEVPWREPIDKDELALMERVDEDLRECERAGIDLPWAEWAELCGHLGVSGARVDALRERAAGREPAIGYRRHDLDADLSGGWVATLPGSFVGSWDDDDSRYWATDGTRAVEFSSFTADGETDSAKLLAVAPERHPVVAQIAEAGRHGRAEAYDEDHVHVVHGLMTCAPHVAILTCKGDHDWALATWRSLRRA